jgi:hypothetical protein
MTAQERARMEMGVLHKLVSTGRVQIGQAVHWGSRIACDLPWEEYGAALGLEDQYDLAEGGHYGLCPRRSERS